jgi:AraC-like DNA-binding protein
LPGRLHPRYAATGIGAVCWRPERGDKAIASSFADIDLLLRGMAVGAQLALVVALARGTPNRSLRYAAILFLAANIIFLLNGSAIIRAMLGELSQLLWVFQLGGAGLLWLFAVVLFEDRRLDVPALLPALLLTAIGLTAQFSPPAISPWLWTAHNLVGLALAGHAMFVIIRSGRVDLVEARRRLRVPFLATVAGYSLLLSTVQLGLLAGIGAGWYQLADAVIQLALGLCGAAVMLEARQLLFGKAEPAPMDQAEFDSDAIWIKKLHAAVEREALWQKEGLTIGDLADAIDLPEHRVRKLINDRLGHRNFPSFINDYRIAAAKELLRDPDQLRRTVASIAYDTGFGSLGPFNRAFRDATGLTPTEWRRRALAEVSPIPENPD